MYRRANGVQTDRQTDLQTDRQTDRFNCRGASLLKSFFLWQWWDKSVLAPLKKIRGEKKGGGGREGFKGKSTNTS